MKIGSWSVEKLSQLIEANSLANRTTPNGLVEASARLHTDMECRTSDTDRLLQELQRGAKILRLAHQPNLFPYDQLQAQLLYLSKLCEFLNSNGGRYVAMVFAVDYDVCGDKRIKGARAFDQSVTGSQIRQFFHEIPRSQREVPAFLAPPPNEQGIERFRRQIVAMANTHGSDGSFMTQASGILRSFPSLADFNLSSWINLAVKYWKLPILFVRLSDLRAVSEPQRQEIADRIRLCTNIPREELLWRQCSNCLRRVSWNETCCSSPEYSKLSIPKVLVDSLSDYFIWNVAGGTSYWPALTHMKETLRVSEESGLPFAYEACWKLQAEVLKESDQFSTANRKASRSLLSNGHNSLIGSLLSEEHIQQYKRRLESQMMDSLARI